MRKILIFIICLFLPYTAGAVEVKEIVSDGGFKVWMIEDHTLPIVSLNITFKHAGSAYDAADKQGLAFLVNGMFNEGAGGMSGIEFRQELESRAIRLSSDIDRDNFYITVKTLKEHLPDALRLLGLALTRSSYNPSEFSIVKEQIKVLLNKRFEDHETIAVEKWYELAFTGHPYANPVMGDLNSIKAIETKDLLKFTKDNFTKSNIVISAVGDFKNDELLHLIDKNFVNLASKQQTKYQKRKGAAMQLLKDKSTFIEFPVSQTVIIFGFPGISKNDPLFFSAFVFNHIFGGGGFESILMNEVRVKHGLAYSVYTYIKNLNMADFFMGFAATRNETADMTLEIIKGELLKLKTTGVTAEALKKAKKYLTGSFPLNLDTNDKLARFLNVMQLDDLGIDYLEKRNNYINSVTNDDIIKLLAKVINLDKLLVVTAGGIVAGE